MYGPNSLDSVNCARTALKTLNFVTAYCSKNAFCDVIRINMSKKTTTKKTNKGHENLDLQLTRKCVYETLCPQLVSHFQDVKMSKK